MQSGEGLGRIEIVQQPSEHIRAKVAWPYIAGQVIPVIEAFLRFAQSCDRPIDWLPILRLQHCEAHHLPRPISQQLVDRDEVAEALAHLLAFDLQEAIVHPEIRHHRGMERAARLRDLVLVMRKYKVDAAAMDIECLTEMLP